MKEDLNKTCSSQLLLRPDGVQPGVFKQFRDEVVQVLTAVSSFSLKTTLASGGAGKLLM